MNNLTAILEGILYVVGDDGITVDQLASVIEDSNAEEIQQVLDTALVRTADGD